MLSYTSSIKLVGLCDTDLSDICRPPEVGGVCAKEVPQTAIQGEVSLLSVFNCNLLYISPLLWGGATIISQMKCGFHTEKCNFANCMRNRTFFE